VSTFVYVLCAIGTLPTLGTSALVERFVERIAACAEIGTWLVDFAVIDSFLAVFSFEAWCTNTTVEHLFVKKPIDQIEIRNRIEC
jgi:hypothetical protein